MNTKLKDENVMDQRLQKMPFVHANYGRASSYAILRVGRKYKSIPLIRGFIKHMLREVLTANADPDRLENNEQVYGAKNLYEDTKEYLEETRINKNSVVGRELLLTASPQFFKGMMKQDFEKWIDTNVEWLKDTFSDNLRAVYLHLDETSPHLHALIIPKLWHERLNKYTLQNYKYFNGVQMLRDMQDSYAEAMQKDFPTLYRGIKGSKAKHVAIKNFYARINDSSQETNLETLQAKAAHEQMLMIKVNHMDKTLKSFQHFSEKSETKNEQLQEKIQQLEMELEELKKNTHKTKDLKQEKKVEKKGVSRNFSGKKI